MVCLHLPGHYGLDVLLPSLTSWYFNIECEQWCGRVGSSLPSNMSSNFKTLQYKLVGTFFFYLLQIHMIFFPENKCDSNSSLLLTTAPADFVVDVLFLVLSLWTAHNNKLDNLKFLSFFFFNCFHLGFGLLWLSHNMTENWFLFIFYVMLKM